MAVQGTSVNTTYNILASGDNIGQIRIANGTSSHYYYLKDHLGSIRVTVNSNGNVDSYNDYYPFGLQMPYRNSAGTADGRYKFVGNERDVETGLDHNGDRSYDSWSCRSHSVDPFASKDPSWSPYSYGHDCPIVICDVNGDSVWVTWQTGFWSFLGLGTDHRALYSGGKLYENGQEYKGDDSYASAALGALNDINSGDAGQTLLKQLTGSKLNYTIMDGGKDNDRFRPDGTIMWNASTTEMGVDANGSPYTESFVGLAHEVSHAYDWDLAIATHNPGLWNSDIWVPAGNGLSKPVLMYEKYACEWENKVRAEHKLTLRKYYVEVKDPSGKVTGGMGQVY